MNCWIKRCMNSNCITRNIIYRYRKPPFKFLEIFKKYLVSYRAGHFPWQWKVGVVGGFSNPYRPLHEKAEEWRFLSYHLSLTFGGEGRSSNCYEAVFFICAFVRPESGTDANGRECVSQSKLKWNKNGVYGRTDCAHKELSKSLSCSILLVCRYWIK